MLVQNESKKLENDIQLPEIQEDGILFLNRTGKNEFEKEQKADKSLEEICQKENQKKSVFLKSKIQSWSEELQITEGWKDC